MSDNIVELRGEILEAEKSRYDLLKWKLVLVSGLGAAGLGIGAKASDDFPYLDYLLCLIPLVCIYVDVLCLHMNLRIMVIGGFLRCSSPADSTVKKYEEFANRMRRLPQDAEGKKEKEKLYGKNAFALEDWALSWSTVVLSVLVVLYASVNFSCADSLRWLSLMVMVLPGIVLAVRLPNIYKKLGPVRGIFVILVLFTLPYCTVADGFARYALLFSGVQEWFVFLTAGMLGLFLTGLMRLIYLERCCAIEAEVKKCKELVDNEPSTLTISTSKTLTISTKE